MGKRFIEAVVSQSEMMPGRLHADVSFVCASPLLERNAGTHRRTPLVDEGPKARARRERRRQIWEAKSQRTARGFQDCVVEAGATTAVMVAEGDATRKRKRDGNGTFIAAKRRACDDGSGIPRAQHERAVMRLENERDEARQQVAQAEARQERAMQRLRDERDAAIRKAAHAVEELQQLRLTMLTERARVADLARKAQAAATANRMRSEYAQQCHEEQQEVIRKVKTGQVPGKKKKQGTRKQRRHWRRLNELRASAEDECG